MSTSVTSALLLGDASMYDDVMSGAKRITIRLGHRAYEPGPVVLFCPDNGRGMIKQIRTVRRVTLENVSKLEFVDDGFATPDELLIGMRRFYPAITWSSPVTVIRWD